VTVVEHRSHAGVMEATKRRDKGVSEARPWLEETLTEALMR
jgi:hypothetical protein